MRKTHIASDETLQEIAASLRVMSRGTALEYDSVRGEYTNQSIASYLSRMRDGRCYGVMIPKGSATKCIKIGANVGIANPVPGTIGTPCIDPYLGKGAFFYAEVNARVDEDGTPHVTAINGDGMFRRDGSNGNVFVMTPVLWWCLDGSDESNVTLKICDTKQDGLSAQPQAYLPDGSLRPYMLYAKYAMSIDSEGNPASVSGRATKNRTVSHNSLITMCKNASSGYSAKTIADDWYVKVMMMIKYATKNSQSIFAGCTSYNYQFTPSVAENSTTRVIVPKAEAAQLVIGSSMMLGTGAKGIDRGSSKAYDTFDAARIIKIEDYDGTNSAVYLDVKSPFDTTITGCLSTAPWHSGSCDLVEGDGSPTNAKNGKEPFVIQGIECMVGLYEVIGDVILKSDGSSGWKAYICYDSKNEAASVNDSYKESGMCIQSGDSDGWNYPMYPDNAGGLLIGQGSGASTTTGLSDGVYSNKTATTGEREFLSLGSLGSGAVAGLFCVSGGNGLSVADWFIGSRLSVIGRSKG